MKIFDKLKSTLKNRATNGLMFAIDKEPLSDISSSGNKLQGWVFSRTSVVQLEFCIDGRPVARFCCQYPRIDVYRNFPDNAYSLVSGFEFELPLNVIGGIGPGRLELFAVCERTRQIIWKWEHGLSTTTEHSSIGEMERFLSSLSTQFPNLPVLKNEGEKQAEIPSLHVVCATSGRYAYLRDTLKVFAKNNISNFAHLQTITVLVDEVASCDEVTQLIADISLPKDIALEIESRNSFQGWNKFVDDTNSSNHLVLYLQEDIDVSIVDFEALVKDFVELPSISVLMPTLYGGSGGVFSSNMSNLEELRSSSFGCISDMPVLYPIKQLGPVWLTSLKFLIAIETEVLSSARSLTSSGLGFCEPPSGTFLFHLDIRQPIVAHDSEVSIRKLLTEEDELPIRMLIENELHFPVKDSRSTAIIIIIEPGWNERNAKTGWRYQIVCLANILISQGEKVIFVSDSDNSDIYLDTIPVLTLNKALDTIDRYEIKWAIATSWGTVRVANIMRYLASCKVAYFIQRLEHLMFENCGRENFDSALWSYQGTFVPIINSNWVDSNLPIEEDIKSSSVVLNTTYDADIFRRLPLSRRPKSILLVLENDSYLDEHSIRAASEVLTSLRLIEAELWITVAGYNSNSSTIRMLLDTADECFAQLTPADMSRLYCTHEVVVDLNEYFGFNTRPLEAIACGAIPIISDLSGSTDYAKHDVHLLSVCHRSPNLICEVISSLFSNPQKTSLIRENGRTLIKELLGYKPQPKIIEQLEQSYSMIVNKAGKQRANRRAVSIVIPVYCALDAVVMCLRSAMKATSSIHHIVIVNDCSDSGTSNWLRDFAAKNEEVTLVELDKNYGFVRACIEGLRACDPTTDIILLNSDVVVSKGCFDRVQNAAYGRFDIGIVSALSNNSPHLQVDMNYGDSLETAATRIADLSDREYPTVITPEGQLLYIRRWVLDKFGFFDPVFNRGFCEESDYCMRTFLNGIDTVCADDAYILHRRSASFGKEARSTHISANRPIFDARWQRYYVPIYKKFLQQNPLAKIRQRYKDVGEAIEEPAKPFVLTAREKDFTHLASSLISTSKQANILNGVEVVFILPAALIGGGSLSVIQHLNELLLRGIQVRVLSLGNVRLGNYPQLAPVIPVSIEQLFNLNWSTQKVVATFWSTAYVVKGLTYRYPSLDAFYYVQDYEPWFYSHPEEYPRVREAEESYELGLKCVAKTNFLGTIVKEKHGVKLEVITPGIDKNTFYPGEQNHYSGRPRLCGLFRPSTSRRGNKECVEVLRQLMTRLPELEVNLFGDSSGLPQDLVGYVRLLGHLTPGEVANLYRNSDIVIDLSYWHGFGRMGIEGMSCGTVPVLSKSGGVDTYAKDGQNAFLVDLENLGLVTERVIMLAKNRELRLQMRNRALIDVESFSETKAADDWERVLYDKISAVELPGNPRSIEIFNSGRFATKVA